VHLFSASLVNVVERTISLLVLESLRALVPDMILFSLFFDFGGKCVPHTHLETIVEVKMFKVSDPWILLASLAYTFATGFSS